MPLLAPRAVPAALAALLLAALIALAAALPDATRGQGRQATTTLFSRALDGGTPNGPSTNPVISGDLRYSQIVAFESEASDLVANDSNGFQDVFAVRRSGSFGDTGSEWRAGATQLVSRGRGGPANGPSFDPSTDGGPATRAKCVAFLSDASNIADGDTNGQTDAFVARAPRFAPVRVSLPGNRQATGDTTKVAVSGDCSRAAFVTGGKLYVRTGTSTKSIKTTSNPADPQFDSGDTNALVFGAKGGVYLLNPGASKGSQIAKGRNPAYINRKRGGRAQRWVVYEKDKGGFSQIAYRQLGGGERLATTWRGKAGNGDSRDPSIFNAGFNMAFSSAASNLPIKTSGETGDSNGRRDGYFFTRTEKFNPPVTAIETLNGSGDQFRAGADNISTSYYRNYVVFDSAGNDVDGPPQVYLRYLGGI
ncbi:MAG TPA: hypothetical protein VF715_03385 [Thermoleophilaceae bacterium]